MVVAEGIETALSLMSGIVGGQHTVWAALSAGGMKRLTLPDCSGRLLIAPDGYDWNDVLTGKAVAG